MSTGKYDPDFIQRVKEFYLAHEVSFDYLSTNAIEIFGRPIPKSDLLLWSRSDVNGSWSVLRANGGRRSDEVPVAEKIQTVANKLYDIIIDEDNELPPGQLAQMAKTWTDLIDKAKLTKEITTAKLPQQAVKDLIAQHDAATK